MTEIDFELEADEEAAREAMPVSSIQDRVRLCLEILWQTDRIHARRYQAAVDRYRGV
jgi:hypothetical protein